MTDEKWDANSSWLNILGAKAFGPRNSRRLSKPLSFVRMMCHRRCVVALLAVAQALRGGHLEPSLELRRKASSWIWIDRRDGAAMSPELAELVRGNSSEAVEMLQKLGKDEDLNVRKGVAQSEALKALVEVKPEEGAKVVKELAEDENSYVRMGVANSLVLKAMMKVRPEEAAQVLMDLLDNDDVRTVRTNLPVWPVFEEYAMALAGSLNRSLEQGSYEEKGSFFFL